MTRAKVVLAVVAAVVVAVAVVAVGTWWVQRATEGGAAAPRPTATPSPAEPTSPGTTAAPTTVCSAGVRRPYVPTTIKVAGVPRSRTVIAPPRDSRGIPGVPPLTSSGKQVFAWDPEQGVRPGDSRGNVLLNAHTWPDGSALGNELLSALQRGDRIVVRGKGAALCYRVTERIEVSAAEGLPRYYAADGPPQLAIVVCSGRRLGPGAWENRTIWFASPSSNQGA